MGAERNQWSCSSTLFLLPPGNKGLHSEPWESKDESFSPHGLVGKLQCKDVCGEFSVQQVFGVACAGTHVHSALNLCEGHFSTEEKAVVLSTLSSIQASKEFLGTKKGISVASGDFVANNG